MNIHNNTHSLLENSLKIGSAIVLVVGASLVIPKIADAAGTLNHVAPEYAIPVAQNSQGEHKGKFQDSSDGYEPPNYGLPSSAYGSGTR